MTIPTFHNVAIVTGGAGSLGQIIASHLAAEGFRILLGDIDGSAVERLADGISGEVIAQALDVRDPAQFEAAVQTATTQWGGVGMLINNAALTRTTPIFDISPEEFDAVTAVTLKGTFIGCQVVGRTMRNQGYGRIINIASLAGQNGGAATGAHYAASKGGVITLTKVFARDLAADGVTVNAISPGPLDLDSVRELLPQEKLAEVTNNIPVQTLGNPDFIAQLIMLIASPQAMFATGATFDVNGGLYLR